MQGDWDRADCRTDLLSEAAALEPQAKPSRKQSRGARSPPRPAPPCERICVWSSAYVNRLLPDCPTANAPAPVWRSVLELGTPPKTMACPTAISDRRWRGGDSDSMRGVRPITRHESVVCATAEGRPKPKTGVGVARFAVATQSLLVPLPPTPSPALAGLFISSVP